MNVLILQGHPDPEPNHLCHALADAYRAGAEAGGHVVRVQTPAQHDIGFLHNSKQWETGALPDYARAAQEESLWAQHIVLVFPLWVGGMPALLKAWMEQTFRTGFAFQMGPEVGIKRKLKGRSARLIVTMGAPVLAYRLIFGAFGTRMLRRSILGMSGVGPIRQTLIGRVDDMGSERAQDLFKEVEALGRDAR
jgi:putative NADPH-quinone reductase